jgi:ATP-dependent DNA helicase RecG
MMLNLIRSKKIVLKNKFQKYPDIKFEWSEPGISFRVTFRKLNYGLETQSTLTEFTDDYGRLRTIADDYGRLSLEEKEILLYLLKNNKITRKEVIEILNIQKTKAHEILSSLVEKGFIQREGKGRSTYYVLKKGKNE